MSIPELVVQQKVFYKTQKTKAIHYRLTLLKALKKALIANEEAIYDALNADFKKSKFESFLSEYALVLSELNLTLKNLKKWSKPKQVKSSILTFPSRDYIYKEPYGTVLIIAPWNYPFLLALAPLIMAVAAGNTVVLKPSELTPHTAAILTKIITSIFPKSVAVTVEGGVETATQLLAQRWDYIFFTGSTAVGKIVAKAAAEHLTPVTLELGGKSPCIVDDTENLNLVARRLIWGKLFNAGQTCIAPDYVIAKSNIKQELIDALKNEIIKQYGDNPMESPDLPRIVNSKNLKRLNRLLENTNIAFGGQIDHTSNYLAPTLVDAPKLDQAIMQNEIFGPILPILTYETEADIDHIISNLDRPLALYVFSKQKAFVNKLIKSYNFGGGVVNDLLVHFSNQNLPFGGVGGSGMGKYHGKHGFDTFSHEKSIMKRGTRIDPPFRYPPYNNKLGLIKKMFKYFG